MITAYTGYDHHLGSGGDIWHGTGDGHVELRVTPSRADLSADWLDAVVVVLTPDETVRLARDLLRDATLATEGSG